MGGQLLRPGDDGYDAARRVWNGRIDRRPALIVRCSGVADVMSAVRFGREHNLLVAVRGGGHSSAGHSVCDDGMVIDLTLMKGMRIDPVGRIAHAQGGLNWGEFDRETGAFGLATTGGQVSTTGIAGLTLGGGIGWLMRKYRLTCDNLLSVDIVTADGRFLTASATENADLFWGVRGGGGNFGIVTSFEYQLHPVSTVLGGMVFHPATKATEVLCFYREYVAIVPDELTTLACFMSAPSTATVPKHLHGAPMIGIGVCYAGPIAEGEDVVRPLRKFGPPVIDQLSPMPYTAVQRMFESEGPFGRHYYRRAHYLTGLTDECIEAIASGGLNVTSPLSHVHIYHLQGAVSSVGEDETAYGYRDAPYTLNIVTAWHNPAEAERHIRWAKEYWATLKPFSTGGAYVNFLGNVGTERVKAAYGAAKYERLATLKNKYDPTNFFSLNQNIKPSV